MKRFVSVMMALALLLCCFAATAELDYRNYSSFPICEPGEVSIEIAVVNDETYNIGELETDNWWWNWAEKVTGIDFDVKLINTSAKGEWLNLTLASMDLPDVFMGFSMTTSDLMMYGAADGVLLNMNDYITPELMPNLSALMDFNEDLRPIITALDGGIYSLPYIQANYNGDSSRSFINAELLNTIGKEIPTTLDEFIDVMYAIKEYDPEMIPLGGGQDAFNPIYYILNAFGYLGEGYNDGTQVTIRNGEVVIPAADELYIEVLKLMNQFYTDGIISQDFYTLDSTMVNAQMADGKLGLYPFVPFTVTPDPVDFQKWESVTPLTSEWNETPQWKAIDTIQVGGFVVSAKTEHVEEILRFADFLYSDIGWYYMALGPVAGSSDCDERYSGWYIDPVTLNAIYPDLESGRFASLSYLSATTKTSVQGAFGNMDVWPSHPEYDYEMRRQWISGLDPVEPELDLSIGDSQFRASMLKYIRPYEVPGYPSVVFRTEEDNYAMADLETVLVPYMQSESAKFITGKRDLSEFDSYLEELEAMGIEEYVGYYADAYNK